MLQGETDWFAKKANGTSYRCIKRGVGSNAQLLWVHDGHKLSDVKNQESGIPIQNSHECSVEALHVAAKLCQPTHNTTRNLNANLGKLPQNCIRHDMYEHAFMRRADGSRVKWTAEVDSDWSTDSPNACMPEVFEATYTCDTTPFDDSVQIKEHRSVSLRSCDDVSPDVPVSSLQETDISIHWLFTESEATLAPLATPEPPPASPEPPPASPEPPPAAPEPPPAAPEPPLPRTNPAGNRCHWHRNPQTTCSGNSQCMTDPFEEWFDHLYQRVPNATPTIHDVIHQSKGLEELVEPQPKTFRDLFRFQERFGKLQMKNCLRGIYEDASAPDCKNAVRKRPHARKSLKQHVLDDIDEVGTSEFEKWNNCIAGKCQAVLGSMPGTHLYSSTRDRFELQEANTGSGVLFRHGDGRLSDAHVSSCDAVQCPVDVPVLTATGRSDKSPTITLDVPPRDDYVLQFGAKRYMFSNAVHADDDATCGSLLCALPTHDSEARCPPSHCRWDGKDNTCVPAGAHVAMRT